MDSLRSYFNENYIAPTYYQYDYIELNEKEIEKIYKLYETSLSMNLEETFDYEKEIFESDFKILYNYALKISNVLNLTLNENEDKVVNLIKTYNYLVKFYNPHVIYKKFPLNIIGKIRSINDVNIEKLDNYLIKKHFISTDFKIKKLNEKFLKEYSKLETFRNFMCKENGRTIHVIKDVFDCFSIMFTKVNSN